MKWTLIGLILSFLLVVLPSFSQPNDIYSFTSPELQQRFVKMTEELRCLVCQNESLADSNASLAQDLRAEVYQQIQKGRTDKAIKDYLVSRYGQFILFKPALYPLTYVLWFLPLILLLAVFVIVHFLRTGEKNLKNKEK